MGVVYKARDPLLERIVALKTISTHLDTEPELRARFFREGRSAARLSHPNIITIYDIGEDGGVAYLAMEYLEGADLKATIAKRVHFSLARKLRIVRAICLGLAHAHGRQVIHRDIKPANIFLAKSGEVKILDFGLARMVAGDITRTGAPVGTPNYMSPEQVRGEKADHRADIFSVGALFYELLSGRRPFDENSVPATIMKILQADPEPLEKVDPSIDPPLARIVTRALAKDAADRYQTADELLCDLDGVVSHLSATGLDEHEDEDEDERSTVTGRSVSSAVLDAATIPEPVEGPGNAAEHGTHSAWTMPTTPTPARSLPKAPPRDTRSAGPVSGTGPKTSLGRRPVLYLGASLILILSLSSVWWLRRQPPGAAPARNDKLSPSPVSPVGAAHPSSPDHPAQPAADRTASGGPRNTETPTRPQEARAPESSVPGGVPSGPRPLPGRDETTGRPTAGSGKVWEDASSRSGEAQSKKPEPEAAARNAEDALLKMVQSRFRAEAVGASQFAAKSYEAARKTELDARSLYERRDFQRAAAKLYETSGLYTSAALEAEAGSEARGRLAEQEKQTALLRTETELSRQSFEQARQGAVNADAPSRAPQKFQEASKLGLLAQAAFEHQEYATAKSQYDAATSSMQQAASAALEAPLRPAVPAPEVTAKTAAPVTIETERQAISSSLQQYTTALQARDIVALKAVWPGLSGKQEDALRNEFNNSRAIRVQLVDLDIRVSGDSATVTGRRLYVIQTLDGQRLETANRASMTLRKNTGTWLLDKIRFEPLR